MKKVTAMLFSMAVGLNAVSMAAKAKASEEQETDVLLIGGGINCREQVLRWWFSLSFTSHAETTASTTTVRT